MNMKVRHRTLIVRVVVSLVFVGLVMSLAVSLSRLKTARMVVDEVLLGSGITILMEKSNYCLEQVRIKEGTGYDPTAALLGLAEDAAVISCNLYALDMVSSDLSGCSKTMDRYHLGDRETRTIFGSITKSVGWDIPDIGSPAHIEELQEEILIVGIPVTLTAKSFDFIVDALDLPR